MAKKEDFFTQENEILFVPDKEYAHIEKYLSFLDAFSRTTHMSMYVVDYFRKNFLYVSDNPLYLCGVPAEKVKEMGHDFHRQYVTDTDLPLLVEINRASFIFMESVPPENRLEYTLSSYFHMKQPSGKAMLVHHKITPIQLSPDGKIWLELFTISLSTQTTSGHIKFSRKGYNAHWMYDVESGEWTKEKDIELKEYEKKFSGYRARVTP